MISVTPGAPLHEIFYEDSTISGSLQTLGPSNDELNNAIATVSAVYWELSSGSSGYLQLFDATGLKFFEQYSASGSLYYLSSSLTVKSPISYYETAGDTVLALFGKF